MISFGSSLTKLSFKLKPKAKQEVKAEAHFETSDPNWREFEKNLKSKHFQEAVKGHPKADEKLKSYVENFGGYLRSKDHVATLTSGDSGRSYRIKRVGGRLGCNCGDWQYKKSHGGGDCKHIKSLKQSKMKLSSLGAMLALYRHPEILGDDAVKIKKKAKKEVAEKLVPIVMAKEAFLNDVLTLGATLQLQKHKAVKMQRLGQQSALYAQQKHDEELYGPQR